MSESRAKWALGFLALLGGLLLLFVGLFVIVAYIVGVIRVLGEPDRSWIFWGLGLVAIGAPGIPIGAGLLVWGLSVLRGGPSPAR